MSRWFAYAVVVLALLPLARLVSGARARSSIFQSTSVATKAEVLKQVPIGTSIEQATAIMEASGFKCLAMQNQRVTEDGPTAGQWIDHGLANILWCDSGEKSFKLVLSRRWQVVFVDTAGLVSYVVVGVGVTGP